MAAIMFFKRSQDKVECQLSAFPLLCSFPFIKIWATTPPATPTRTKAVLWWILPLQCIGGCIAVNVTTKIIVT